MEMGTLTLSRRAGEKIVIGTGDDAIVIEVRERPSGGEVSLRITAPRVVPVWREELPDRPR